MKTYTLYTLAVTICVILFTSCATSQKAYNKGQYYTATQRAIQQIKKHPNREKEIILLESAYAKSMLQINQKIKALEADNNPDQLENIWTLYKQIQDAQNAIQVLQPLQINSQRRQANFAFTDVTKQVVDSKYATVQFLYAKANGLLQTPNRFAAREAIAVLQKINNMQGNYLQTNAMLAQARQQATTNIQIQQALTTKQIVEKEIGLQIMDEIQTSRLQNGYLQYYTNTASVLAPNYFVVYQLNDISISPNKETTNTTTQTTKIASSWIAKIDANNKPIYDTNGKPIVDTTYKTYTCKIQQTDLQKTIGYQLIVNLQDGSNGKILATQTMATDTVWQYTYSTYTGDKEALNPQQKLWITNKAIGFASNEKLIEALANKSANQLEAWLKDDKQRNKMQ